MIKYFFLLIFFVSNHSFALDIDKTIQSTIQNNFKVKIGLEKISESKELIENAIGEKLPSVTGTITGTYSNSEIETATTDTSPETFTDNYKIKYAVNLKFNKFPNHHFKW